jgi:hypothetical protein
LIAKLLDGWRPAAAIVVVLSVVAVHAEPFRTKDPLRAFVREEYPLGNDYFVRGNEDTYLFRCFLSRGPNRFNGIALSEISIWGKTGPWEIFRRESNGDFVYLETGELPSTSCLESCRSKEYLRTGRCTWQRGWPK